MFINSKICFIESNLDNSQVISGLDYYDVDSSTDRENISATYNFIATQNGKPGPGKFTISAGVFSKLHDSQLINSNVYKSDLNVKNKGEYFPFNENGKENSLQCVNPIIFQKTYGVGTSELFDDTFTTPFTDLPNLEIELSFKDLYTPNYYNAYVTHDLYSSISVVGQLEEVTGKSVIETEFGLKGLSLDKAITVSDTVVVKKGIVIDETRDPFLEDEEIFVNDSLQKYNFNYETININGNNYIILKLNQNSYTYLPNLNRNIMYSHEEVNVMQHFDDSILQEDVIEVKLPSGSCALYSDKSIILGSDSIGFAGEID